MRGEGEVTLLYFMIMTHVKGCGQVVQVAKDTQNFREISQLIYSVDEGSFFIVVFYGYGRFGSWKGER